MNDILSQDEISDMLEDFASDTITNNKFDQQSKKIPPFDQDLDFSCKNMLNPEDINIIKSLIYFLVINYKNKLSEIKRNNKISDSDIEQTIVSGAELENYFNLDGESYKNENNETFIKEYLIDGEQIIISVPVILINLFLGRIKNKKSDKVSKYAANLYFFDLIKSYLNQLLPSNSPKLKDGTENNINLKENQYLVFKPSIVWDKNIVPFTICMNWKACYKILNKSNPEEIIIHSNDYYKKQGGFIVISGNYFTEEELASLKNGSPLNFTKQKNNKCDLVLNNKLIAKGKVGTYRYNELYTRFEITDLIDNSSTNQDYFNNQNNTYLIFATTNKSKAEEKITKYIPGSQIQLKLDTKINTSDILLIYNNKIVATVEINEYENRLEASLKKQIIPGIPII